MPLKIWAFWVRKHLIMLTDKGCLENFKLLPKLRLLCSSHQFLKSSKAECTAPIKGCEEKKKAYEVKKCQDLTENKRKF